MQTYAVVCSPVSSGDTLATASPPSHEGRLIESDDVYEERPTASLRIEPLLTLEQAARYLNVSKASLRRWTNDGRLACHRLGARGERRFARTDLDAHRQIVRTRSTTAGRDGPLPAGQVPHVSTFFRDEDELWAMVRPYVLQHIRAGLPIVYICAAITPDDFRGRLRAEGHDPAPLESSGLLRLLTADTAYLRTGTFTADGMITFMESAIVERVRAGHRALMLSGEMTWFFSGAPGVEEMWAYETRLNDLMARYPGVTTVCSYDLRRFDGVGVVEALCSHPYARLPDREVRGFYG